MRARVTPAGVPVFAPDPSRLARLLGPVALAGSLAACSPASQVASHATPVTLVSGYSGNGNDQPPPRRVPVARVAPPAVHPTPTSTNPIEPHEEWAGMMVME